MNAPVQQGTIQQAPRLPAATVVRGYSKPKRKKKRKPPQRGKDY